MNNRFRQIIRAIKRMNRLYDRPSDSFRAWDDVLNEFARGFAAGVNDTVNSIREQNRPTVQNMTITYSFDELTEEEKRMNGHIPCEGCKHDLGGGCCRINLEPECREGGGYEAWEPKELPEPEYVPTKGETALKWFCFVLCCLLYPLAIYKIYEWVVYFLNKP